MRCVAPPQSPLAVARFQYLVTESYENTSFSAKFPCCMSLYPRLMQHQYEPRSIIDWAHLPFICKDLGTCFVHLRHQCSNWSPTRWREGNTDWTSCFILLLPRKNTLLTQSHKTLFTFLLPRVWQNAERTTSALPRPHGGCDCTSLEGSVVNNRVHACLAWSPR
jgi:hypothetical protein